MTTLPRAPFSDVSRERTLVNARRWAVAYLASILDMPAAQIDLAQSVSKYGLDSVDAVVMSGAMEEHFEVELDPSLYLDVATLNEAIALLARDPLWRDDGS